MDDGVAIKVENLSKTFRLPHEKHSSVKSLFVNFYKRKRTYEVQHALKDVSFEIKKGEFFGIVGRNGSGKSTLLKLMAGIYSPTRGRVIVNGSLTPFIELGVGFNPELTGRENVYLNGALLGFSRKEMNKMYNEIVEFAELEKFMDQKLKNYSSGMQVRLAFSIAIRAHSDILLIDEVLAVGDASFQRKCFGHFESLKKQNKTVILVSHDMGAVKRFCNRAALITDGKLTYIGSADQVAELYEHQNTSDTGLSDERIVSGGGVEIIGIKIIKPKSRNYFLENEDVKMQLDLKAKHTKDIYIGIQIIGGDGQVVSGITSQLKMEPIHITPEKQISFEFAFPCKQLTNGIYGVDGTLYEAGIAQPIFYRPAMAQFELLGRRGWGLINLDGNWRKIQD